MWTVKTDQTGLMPRLICLRWVHSHFVGFVMLWLMSGLSILFTVVSLYMFTGLVYPTLSSLSVLYEGCDQL